MRTKQTARPKAKPQPPDAASDARFVRAYARAMFDAEHKDEALRVLCVQAVNEMKWPKKEEQINATVD